MNVNQAIAKLESYGYVASVRHGKLGVQWQGCDSYFAARQFYLISNGQVRWNRIMEDMEDQTA